MTRKDAVARFRKRVAELRRDFPSPDRVVVYLRDHGSIRDDDGHRLFGQCWRASQSFVIVVEQATDISVSIDTLWHEWAHILVWPDTEHSQRFFSQYGRIYKHYQG